MALPAGYMWQEDEENQSMPEAPEALQQLSMKEYNHVPLRPLNTKKFLLREVVGKKRKTQQVSHSISMKDRHHNPSALAYFLSKKKLQVQLSSASKANLKEIKEMLDKCKVRQRSDLHRSLQKLQIQCLQSSKTGSIPYQQLSYSNPKVTGKDS